MSYGISNIVVKEKPDGESRWYTYWFVFVLEGNRRLGKDLPAVLALYGIRIELLELSLGKVSVYRIDVEVLVATGAKPEDDQGQDEILRIVERLHNIGPSNPLKEHAEAIEAEFADLAGARNR